MCVGSCMRVTQKKMLCLNLQKQSQTFPDSFENISVNIRFIHCKHMKGE